MKKINRHFILPFILIALFLTGCSKKSQEKKVYKVGILCGIKLFEQTIDSFVGKMTNLGYIENKNIIYDRQILSEEDDKEMQTILDKFVENKVDLILTVPTGAALKAKKVIAGTDIPMVFASAYTNDNDLIKSVREPGNDITGVRWPSSAELGMKRIEILNEIVPKNKRLWMAYDKEYPGALATVKAFRQITDSLGMSLVEVPLLSLSDMEADLEARDKLNDIGIDAAIVTPLRFATYEDMEKLFKFTDSHKIPFIGNIEFSLFSLYPDLVKSGEHSAYLVDKILKEGVTAGKIPVVTAENYLKINYKKAQELGIDIPEEVLARADEIIK